MQRKKVSLRNGCREEGIVESNFWQEQLTGIYRPCYQQLIGVRDGITA
jgi:hypothetical protein